MKPVRLFAFLLLVLIAGCAKSQSFVLLPGQSLYLTNNMGASRIRFRSDYPVTVREGNCELVHVAAGNLDCNQAAPIIITDDRPGILIWAHANDVTIYYNPIATALR